MRYFSIGNKATIKIDDEKISLEEVKQKFLKMNIINQDEVELVKEITRKDFLEPLESIPENLPKWEDLIEELRINSTGVRRTGAKRKKK